MPFQPKGQDHSIIEAVFGFTFSRPLAPQEIEAVAANHAQWKADLPRLARQDVMQFTFDVSAAAQPQPIPSIGGVAFERFKPDGTLDWRLRVDPGAIWVNCLSYTRWSGVYPLARRYMAEALEVLRKNPNSINSVVLQYIDIYEWQGEKAQYSARELFDVDSPYVSHSIFEVGHLWHMHQGWLKPTPLTKGRVLERIHAEGVENEHGVAIVKLDSYIQYQLEAMIPASSAFRDKIVDPMFEDAHDQAKVLLRKLLNDDTARRIGLT